ncbi:MAG: ankyrin repeat domain-containing protein [Limisphaerales bacterium]
MKKHHWFPSLGLVGLVVLMSFSGCGPGKPATSLHQAVQKGDLKAVQQHIAARSDLNVKDKYGWAPLHFAAMKGQLPIVKALTAGGADVNRTGPGGKTPLDMAREKGQVAVAQYLQNVRPASGGGGRGLVDGGLGVSSVLDSQ